MKLKRILPVVLVLLLFGQAAFAVMYLWKDKEGSTHATDRKSRVPRRYQALLRYDDRDRYVSPDGLGFERNNKGNIRFFDHSSPAKRLTEKKSKSNRNVTSGATPGSAVTEKQYRRIRQAYQEWGEEPVPSVKEVKVLRIVSPDTFQIKDRQKVTYNGVKFPSELPPDSEVYKEAVAYQKKLMQGKTVHLVFGKKRYDEKGRLMAYVYLGKDVFVNAELIMNGYARVNIEKPNTDYRTLFNRLQKFARKSMLGIWSSRYSFNNRGQ
ncbi:MAG: thermonuclease family protein [bacterium]